MPSTRPTVRAVARAAGVSPMTASRALRNDPAVSVAARLKVEKAARTLRYRPDPQLGKLMSYLRSREKSFHGNLCALTDVPASDHRPYLEEVMEGVRQRAESMGFGCTLFRLSEIGGTASHLQRMLVSRGVEGIVLLPMATTTTLETLVDWSLFSVVSTTRSVRSPIFLEIVPDHFRNMLEICDRLTARGYRRIGLALQRDYVLRVNHAFNAAAAWHAAYHGYTPMPSYVFEGEHPRQLRRWFRRHRPDAIVSNTAANCRAFAAELGLPVVGPVAFATTNVFRPEPLISGLDERPRAVGVTAVEQLAALIQRGEKGAPVVPTTISVRGEWLEARSCAAKAPPKPRATPNLLMFADRAEEGRKRCR